MTGPAHSWNEGRTLLIVTGASRGLGRAFAESLSKCLNKDSVVVLTARSAEDLQVTAQKVDRPEITVKTYQRDHTKDTVDCYNLMMDEVAEVKASDESIGFETLCIVHNVGSTGRLGPLSGPQDPEEIANCLALNYTSPAILNSVVLRKELGPSGLKRSTVINVSSLLGIQAWKSVGHYCSVKAAREMLFKVLALENPDNMRVLNYAPGPIDTEMVKGMMRDPDLDADVLEGYRKMYSDKSILRPEETAEKLARILQLDKYESGQHVDYYDDE